MLKGTLCTVRHLQAADLNTYISLVNDLPSRGEFFSLQFKSPEAMRRDFLQTGFVTEDSELFLIEDKAQHIIGTI
ncbi:MAG: ribosomal protein acetyltransferase, partial [Janthinobacterium sp.]